MPGDPDRPRHVPMETPASDLDPVERARSYPYIAPGFSYLFQDGTYVPIGGDALAAATEGLLPVIACGSNRAPEQLARKFGGFPGIAIPVERVWLTGFDTVYAAHLSGYASVSATIHPAEGVTVGLSLTWLDERLMDRMDATEGRGFSYNYARLDRLDMRGESGRRYEHAYAYLYSGGALRLRDAPIGLKEVEAKGRTHRAFRQGEAQAYVVRKLGLDISVNEFIRQNVADADLRLARETELQKDALKFDWPHTQIIP